MEDITTPHGDAVAAVETAEATGHVAAALIVFDALDEHRDLLTPMDRYDFALGTWNRMVDNELPITDEQVVTLAVRAAAHLPEHTMVDLIGARFSDRPVDIKLPDGRGLVWMPEDELVILSWPMAGGVADVILGRSTVRA